MTDPTSHLVTRLLDAVGRGDETARERLFETVYHELRGMAASHIAREHGPRSLQPTALVHEAYLRLMGGQSAGFNGKAHFFSAAAEAMRRILVEYARKRAAIKRGAGQFAQTLLIDPPAAGSGEYDAAELLAVNEVLDAFSTAHPRQAEVVKQRYFMGLTVEETAGALEISPRTVELDWQFARAWLRRALKD